MIRSLYACSAAALLFAGIGGPALAADDSTAAILRDCGGQSLPASAVDSCLERARVADESDPSPALESLIASLQQRVAGDEATGAPRELGPDDQGPPPDADTGPYDQGPPDQDMGPDDQGPPPDADTGPYDQGPPDQDMGPDDQGPPPDADTGPYDQGPPDQDMDPDDGTPQAAPPPPSDDEDYPPPPDDDDDGY